MFAQALGEYGVLVGALEGLELLTYSIQAQIAGIDRDTWTLLGAVAVGVLFLFWIRRR